MHERYHGLDLLRAAAMLLGPVVHALVIYDQPEVYAEIAGRPAATLEAPGAWVPLLAGWIHAWRMPLFFALAGFFAAMVIARKGPRPWALDRGMRVLGPLVLFVALHNLMLGGPPGQLLHLWFLYYLALFCGLAVLAAAIVPGAWWRAASWPMARPSRLWLVLPVLAGLTMVARDGGIVSIIPERAGEVLPGSFAYFLLFFALGAALHAHRGTLNDFAAPRALALTGGVAVSAHLGLLAFWEDNTPPETAWADVFGGIATGAWCVLLIGAAQAFGARPSRMVGWLVRVAYPVYLLHLVPTLVAASLLAAAGANAVTVMVLGASAGTMAALAAYYAFIRWTPLDALIARPAARRGSPPPPATI